MVSYIFHPVSWQKISLRRQNLKRQDNLYGQHFAWMRLINLFHMSTHLVHKTITLHIELYTQRRSAKHLGRSQQSSGERIEAEKG